MKTLLALLALSAFVPSAHANSGDPFQARCNIGRGSCSFACPAQCDDEKQVFAAGEFASIGRHSVTGAAQIEVLPRLGTYLTLSPEFRTTPGPDLRIVLRDSRGVYPMQVLATLDQVSGAQKYLIPEGMLDFKNYDEVVIYCFKYHVDFGIAKLMQ